MRLIDADEAKKLIFSIDSCFAEFVDNIPTAYDVEAVVRELEKNKRGFFILDGVTVRTIPLDKAIRIVRGGRNEHD